MLGASQLVEREPWLCPASGERELGCLPPVSSESRAFSHGLQWALVGTWVQGVLAAFGPNVTGAHQQLELGWHSGNDECRGGDSWGADSVYGRGSSEGVKI